MTATALGAPGPASFNLSDLLHSPEPGGDRRLHDDGGARTILQTSLREAIAYAESLPGNQTVTFDPADFSTPQTIVLTLGQLNLTPGHRAHSRSRSPGTDLLSISGNNACPRVLSERDLGESRPA